MKNYLYSRSEVIVENNQTQHKISFSLPLIVENGDIIKVFSLEKNSLPFCFEVGKFNENIKEIHFENYTIFEIQPPKVLSGEYFKSKTFKNGLASVVGVPFRFNILLDGGQFSKNISQVLSDIEIKELKNCIVLMAKAKEEDYSLIFHKKSKDFLEIVGNVSLSESKISAVQNKNTLAKHGELTEFEITEKTIKCLSKEPVYLNKKPLITPPFLTHIAFFEAVKEQDFELAKNYLTTEFAQNLTPTHFKNFFGDFEEIKPIKENGEIKIALLKKQSENVFFAKVFALEYLNNKISNIEEE